MDLRHVGRAARLACVSALAMVAIGGAAEGAAEAPPSTAPPASTTSTTTTSTPAPPTTTAASPSESAPEGSTARILLTNDDGWAEGGMLALRDALLRAGFEVIVFAPAEEASGTSASLTLRSPVTISHVVEGVYSVDGSPADAVEAGLSLAFPDGGPDLVIAGPNPGVNIANAAIHSGTVGAAVTAINEGVPAIAVNSGADAQTGDVDFTATNTFVVALVDALIENAGREGLLPDGLGLNINVPFTVDDAPPAGVQVTTTDRSFVDPNYAGAQLPAVGDSIEVQPELVIAPTADPESDSAALDAGLVSITFIEGNYDTTQRATRADELGALVPMLTGLL